MNEETLSGIFVTLENIKLSMGDLVTQQKITNYLSVANNMAVPENIRNEALNMALSLMGMQYAQTKEENPFDYTLK